MTELHFVGYSVQQLHDKCLICVMLFKMAELEGFRHDGKDYKELLTDGSDKPLWAAAPDPRSGAR